MNECVVVTGKPEVRRYVMPYMEANMYICIEGTAALIVDPHSSKEALKYLQSNKVKTVTVLLTHEHFDHISGVPWLKDSYPTKVICQSKCGESIAVPRKNRPLALLLMRTEKNFDKLMAFYESFSLYAIVPDIIFDDQYVFCWQGHDIRIQSLPGHSLGSVAISFDEQYLFTGDYMIPDEPVILRYPGGSREAYEQYTLPYLLTVPKEKIIMPGHGNECYMNELIYKNGIFYRKK